jgi:hypothetical protein
MQIMSEVDLHGNQQIGADIFEYFLSNIPDFSSYVIKILTDELDLL